MHEIELDRIDSTNTYAKIHAPSFPPNTITCITANEQTAGRGRFGRPWLSPKDQNIYATFSFSLPTSGSLAQLMAASLIAVLRTLGLSPLLKWPNDVLLNGKKLAGHLCETYTQSQITQIILGVGININMDAQTAAQIDQPVTSLFLETGILWDRRKILKDLQHQFEKDLDQFEREGLLPFCALLNETLAYKGEKIILREKDQTITGICHSIAPNGQLNLLQDNNTIHTLFSGDLSICRRHK